MSKLADYSQLVTVAQLDAALRAGEFEGVFHYLGGDDALRVEEPAVVEGIAELGWEQAGIFVPGRPSSVNGAADAARAAEVYGWGPGRRLYLDIEPDVFELDPVGWARAADGWCHQVRAAGYSPGGYGTDETLAACCTFADTIWRAKPGMCEPDGPGLAETFFPGRRAVQCAVAIVGGVEFDVSFSQFPLGGDMARLEPDDLLDPGG